MIKIISDKARRCLESFIKWGGLSIILIYFVEGKIENAVWVGLLFLLIVIFTEKRFNKLP